MIVIAPTYKANLEVMKKKRRNISDIRLSPQIHRKGTDNNLEASFDIGLL